MNNKLQAVVTDLDGSLLGPDHQIGTEDIETIRALKAQGIPVFVATGRHQGICRCFVEQIGTDYPTIVSNGSVIIDLATNTVLECDLMSPEDVAELIAFCERNNLLYHFYTDTYTYMNASQPDLENYKLDLAFYQDAASDEWGTFFPPFDYTQQRIVKVLVPACTPEVEELLRSEPVSSRVEPAISGFQFMDITPIGSNKASGIQKLARRYGFSLDGVLAMGDNFNDMAMLQAVGMPVAPASAVEAIRGIAKFVTTPSGQNPLTHAIRTLYPELLR